MASWKPMNSGRARSRMTTTLKGEFRWEVPEPASATDGEAATWGYLRVTFGSRRLWGAAEGSSAPGILWTWIDLLDYLASNWPWLIGEHGWPPNAVRAE